MIKLILIFSCFLTCINVEAKRKNNRNPERTTASKTYSEHPNKVDIGDDYFIVDKTRFSTEGMSKHLKDICERTALLAFAVDEHFTVEFDAGTIISCGID